MNIKFLAIAVAGAVLLSSVSLSSAETMAQKIATPLMFSGLEAPVVTENVSLDKRIDRLIIESISESAFINERQPM